MKRLLIGIMLAAAMACVFGGSVFADSAGTALSHVKERYPDKKLQISYVGDWNDRYLQDMIAYISNTSGAEVESMSPNSVVFVEDYGENGCYTGSPNYLEYERVERDSNGWWRAYGKARLTLTISKEQEFIGDLEGIMEKVDAIKSDYVVDDLDAIGLARNWGYGLFYRYSSDLREELMKGGFELILSGDVSERDSGLYHRKEANFSVRYDGIFIPILKRIRMTAVNVIYADTGWTEEKLLEKINRVGHYERLIAHINEPYYYCGVVFDFDNCRTKITNGRYEMLSWGDPSDEWYTEVMIRVEQNSERVKSKPLRLLDVANQLALYVDSDNASYTSDLLHGRLYTEEHVDSSKITELFGESSSGRLYGIYICRDYLSIGSECTDHYGDSGEYEIEFYIPDYLSSADWSVYYLSDDGDMEELESERTDDAIRVKTNKLSSYYDGSTDSIRTGKFVVVTDGASFGWNGDMYLDDGGMALSGFLEIDGNTYYLDPVTKKAQRGQRKIDGYWYYFDRNTKVMAKSKFVTLSKAETNDGPKTVYYDKNGHMLYGFRTISGNRYYLKPNNGALQKGHMRVDDYWYMFDSSSGAMKRSEFYTMKKGESGDAPKTVYFDENGHLLYGFQNVGGQTYYLHKKSGALQKGQQKIDGHWYYMDSNSGVVAKSKFITLSKAETKDGPKTVYYDKSGHMLYGIRNIGGNIYYLKKGSGALQKGHMRVDGYWYFFDKNTGAAKKSTFYTMQPGESGDAPKTVYFDGKGHVVYGMQYINGRYYYFQKGSGRLLD